MDNKKVKQMLNNERKKYYFNVSEHEQFGLDWVRIINPCSKKDATHYTKNKNLALEWKRERKIYYHDNFSRNYLCGDWIDAEFMENFIKIDK